MHKIILHFHATAVESVSMQKGMQRQFFLSFFFHLLAEEERSFCVLSAKSANKLFDPVSPRISQTLPFRANQTEESLRDGARKSKLSIQVHVHSMRQRVERRHPCFQKCHQCCAGSSVCENPKACATCMHAAQASSHQANQTPVDEAVELALFNVEKRF